MNEIRLLYGSTIPGQPLLSSDLLWKTQFKAPDPFFFCEFEDGHNVMLMGMLEYERARKEAQNCEVELLNPFMDKVKSLELIDGLIEFLKGQSPNKIIVHRDMPYGIVWKLEKAGFQISIHDQMIWYPKRATKSAKEIQQITEVQRITEKVVSKAIQILREAKVSLDGMLIDQNDDLITSEHLRKFMDIEFMREGCILVSAVIACGDQGVDPHCNGFGPLRANLPIVMDIFPRSKEHFYWADMTRTVFKGEPIKKAQKMYQTVLEGQCLAIGMIHADIDGSTIQKAVEEFFEKSGYQTDKKDGTLRGFFHGVGHGLGIDIHERPGIRKVPEILPEGCVVTVEPGLYYLGIGGIRIEDIVVVTKYGSQNLTQFPKELEAMVL